MRCEILVVGAGPGASPAAGRLLDRLAAALPVPLVADRAPGSSGLRIATDKESPEAGWVYCAPEGYHLLVDRGSLALASDPPVNGGRPSIDLLFESAAESYGRAAAALLLDLGPDGVEGMARIRERGGSALQLAADQGDAVERVVDELVARTRRR